MFGCIIKKEVHSIYTPIRSFAESKIINNKTCYYKDEKGNDEIIIKKIIDKCLKKK